MKTFSSSIFYWHFSNCQTDFLEVFYFSWLGKSARNFSRFFSLYLKTESLYRVPQCIGLVQPVFVARIWRVHWCSFTDHLAAKLMPVFDEYVFNGAGPSILGLRLHPSIFECHCLCRPYRLTLNTSKVQSNTRIKTLFFCFNMRPSQSSRLKSTNDYPTGESM